MVSDSRSASILDLPLFLREEIYDYVFQDAHIYISACTSRGWNDRSRKPNWQWHQSYTDRTVPCPTLAIAQTCRALRQEALVRFYKLATFHYMGHSGVVARLVELSEVKSEDGEMTTTDEISKHEEKSDKEIEEELEFRIALDTQKEVMKNMQRLIDDLCEMPEYASDTKPGTWDAILQEYFPNLKEIRLDLSIQCCRCDYKPLAGRGSLRDRNQDQQQADQRPEITDGQYLRNIITNAPKHVRVWFELDMMDTCTANGATIIELDPNAEPKVKVKEWFNYYTCNDYLVQLLHQFGIPDEANRMQKMIDDGAPSLDDRWAQAYNA